MPALGTTIGTTPGDTTPNEPGRIGMAFLF